MNILMSHMSHMLQVREYGEIAYAVLDQSEGNESSFDVYLDAQRQKHPLLPGRSEPQNGSTWNKKDRGWITRRFKGRIASDHFFCINFNWFTSTSFQFDIENLSFEQIGIHGGKIHQTDATAAEDGEENKLVGENITMEFEDTTTLSLRTLAGNELTATFHSTHIFLQILGCKLRAKSLRPSSSRVSFVLFLEVLFLAISCRG